MTNNEKATALVEELKTSMSLTLDTFDAAAMVGRFEKEMDKGYDIDMLGVTASLGRYDASFRTKTAEEKTEVAAAIIAKIAESPELFMPVEESSTTAEGTTSDDFLVGTDGDDTINGLAGNDILRGGAGVDTLDGGDGDDAFVIVGDISDGGKVDSDTDTAVLGFNLTDLNGQDLNEDEDGAAETIMGGEGDDTLYVFGTADTTNMTIESIEHVEVRSDVKFSDAFLEVVSSVTGDGSSTIRIVSKSDTPSTLNLETLELSGIGHIEIEGDVTLELSDIAQLGGARILSGEGTVQFTGESDFDLAGFVTTDALSFFNSDGSEAVGSEVVSSVTSSAAGNIVGTNANDYLIGTASDETLTSGDGTDIMLGKAGDDIYTIDGSGDKTILDSSGIDTLDLTKAAMAATIDLATGATLGDESVKFGSDSTKESLDLIILEDLSGSFSDDVRTVQGLLDDLITDIKAIQPDTYFGAASFVDKPGYGGSTYGDYVYKTEAKLTSDGAAIQAAFDAMVVQGGADGPESQLEALYQIALRTTADSLTSDTASDEIGFRENSMKVVVVATDANYHQAGESWYGDPLVENNGDTIIDPNEDYPTVAAVKEALLAANIYPIFAVTDSWGTTNTDIYTDLVSQLGRGDVVPLSSDSSDLISSITEGLNNVSLDFIENLQATAFDDTITSNSLDNNIDGGDGADTIIYEHNYADYEISNEDGVVQITHAKSATDTIKNVEYFQFADQTVSLDTLIAGDAEPVEPDFDPTTLSKTNAALGSVANSTTAGVAELESGNEWESDSVSYSFLESFPSADYAGYDLGTGWTTLNTAQKASVNDIMTQIDDLLGINLTQVSGSEGDIRFSLVDQTESAAFAFYPGTGIGGDVFLSTDFNDPSSTSDYTMDVGGYGWGTIVHELGHAFGLEHPFGNFTADPSQNGNAPHLDSEHDNGLYSVMSYTDLNNFIPVFETDGAGIEFTAEGTYPTLYSIYDLNALQSLYGVNTTTNTENNTYSYDFSEFGYHTIWDAGGVDTLDLALNKGDTTLDLNGGSLNNIDMYTTAEVVSYFQEEVGDSYYNTFIEEKIESMVSSNQLYTGYHNLGIGTGVIIENVTTGAGDDRITDNAVDNIINTGLGNDIITLGTGGFDSVDGGEGNDILEIDVLQSSVTIQAYEDNYLLYTDSYAVQFENIETISFSDSVLNEEFFIA